MAQLPGDVTAIFFFPGPGLLQKRFSANFLAGSAFPFQHLFNLELGGNARVIHTRHPQGGFALHPGAANHQVFQRHKHDVAHMEFTRHVRRRDRNSKRFSVVGSGFWLEPARFFPPCVQSFFCTLKIIGFGHVGHSRLVL